MVTDLSIYFEPLDLQFSHLLYVPETKQGILAERVEAYLDKNNFPNWSQSKLVILGVNEDRLSNNAGSAEAPNVIRKYLYKLSTPSQCGSFVDLGNIKSGHTIQDTFFALSSVVKELVKKNCTVLILGGTQNLTFPIYKAFESLEQVVNIACIDRSFDFGEDSENCTNQSYLSHIVTHQPSYLFNFCNIGFQSYFVAQHEKELIDKLFFDAHRLGLIQTNLEEAEPLVRNADIVSIDFSSVRMSDAPGNANASPNGFYGEELCQLSRYAGFSDKTIVVGFFEINPRLDNRDQTSQLAAQAAWFFIEGFFNRKGEIPVSGSEEFTKYRVALDSSPEHEVVFFKSKNTARWWMSVPFPPDKKLKFERHHLVPCSYQDYQLAAKNELPDRWWQTYQKLF